MKQNDPRLAPMLDELLTSRATPEEVCAACPELLPELRRQWNELSKVRAELEHRQRGTNEGSTRSDSRATGSSNEINVLRSAAARPRRHAAS